jgi:hypothetical protein
MMFHICTFPFESVIILLICFMLQKKSLIGAAHSLLLMQSFPNEETWLGIALQMRGWSPATPIVRDPSVIIKQTEEEQSEKAGSSKTKKIQEAVRSPPGPTEKMKTASSQQGAVRGMKPT